MDKQTAVSIMERLDERLCWSQAEYERGVREAEAEGDEPMGNPRVFSVRLDATDDGDYCRLYRVRVTPGGWAVGYDDWRAVIDLAETAGCAIVLQNNGVELS